MDRSNEFFNLLKVLSTVERLTDAAKETDFSVAVGAITARFENKLSRHISEIRKLVDQRSLFYNDPSHEIEDLSMTFEREDHDIEGQLSLLVIWLDKHTVRGTQRRKQADIVLSSLRERKTDYVSQFGAALKIRAEVLKTKVH
jgi:hypothetical protein